MVVSKKISECIKNTALFLYLSVRHTRENSNKEESVCSKIHPEMSVRSKQGHENAESEFKGNVENKIHVQFHG